MRIQGSHDDKGNKKTDRGKRSVFGYANSGRVKARVGPLSLLNQTRPWASIASATFLKPAMLAPTT